MSIKRLTGSLTLILGILAMAISASAGKPDGKGGRREETSATADLHNFNFGDCGGAPCYALAGDQADDGTSLYEDADLEDSVDCALVIATTIDKESGMGFLYVPNPRRRVDNCELYGSNRKIRIWQPDPGSGMPNPWSGNPRLDIPLVGGEGYIEVDARIDFAGLYRPVEDVAVDGINVSIAIGPYRIAYPTTAATVVIGGDPDIRTVIVDATVASICKWQKGGKNGKQDVCLEVPNSNVPSGIRLPFEVVFTRIPP